jgi:hypothetical protein
MADAMQSTESLLRQGGRGFLITFYAALRSLRLYPVENDQVQHALDDLTARPRPCSRSKRKWKSVSPGSSSS